MKMSVTVCNVCKNVARPTTPWLVGRNGDDELSLDLCEEHDKPLCDLLDLLAAVASDDEGEPGELALVSGRADKDGSSGTAPTKRAPAKKATSKAVPTRRPARANRTSPTMTLEELEARKSQERSAKR